MSHVTMRCCGKFIRCPPKFPLSEALAAKHLAFERLDQLLFDQLLIIPFDNVQEIELTPVPPKVPEYVVKNVKSI